MSKYLRVQSNNLIFQEKPLEVVTINGEEWVTSKSISEVLGYKDVSSLNRVFQRRSDEFSSSMTTTVKMTGANENNPYSYNLRIFSLRGAHLISMISKTSPAKEFRKFVLDVLEEKASSEGRPELTRLAKSYKRENELIKKEIKQQKLEHMATLDTVRDYALEANDLLRAIGAIDMTKPMAKWLITRLAEEARHNISTVGLAMSEKKTPGKFDNDYSQDLKEKSDEFLQIERVKLLES